MSDDLNAARKVLRKMSTSERAELLDDMAEETGDYFTPVEFAQLNEELGYEGTL